MFQWTFGTLCKETGCLTFLIYICLIFRRSLWKYKITVVLLVLTFRWKRWLWSWEQTQYPFVGGLPHNLFLPLGTVFIAMSKSILLPPPQNIFGIHRLAYHFVPPLFSNISMAFCLGTGALESSPWSTRPLLSWALFGVSSHYGQVMWRASNHEIF